MDKHVKNVFVYVTRCLQEMHRLSSFKQNGLNVIKRIKHRFDLQFSNPSFTFLFQRLLESNL